MKKDPANEEVGKVTSNLVRPLFTTFGSGSYNKAIGNFIGGVADSFLSRYCNATMINATMAWGRFKSSLSFKIACRWSAPNPRHNALYYVEGKKSTSQNGWTSGVMFLFTTTRLDGLIKNISIPYPQSSARV
jgi:hypothetical protein